jgi:dihydrofolate reductase
MEKVYPDNKTVVVSTKPTTEERTINDVVKDIKKLVQGKEKPAKDEK